MLTFTYSCYYLPDPLCLIIQAYAAINIVIMHVNMDVYMKFQVNNKKKFIVFFK